MNIRIKGKSRSGGILDPMDLKVENAETGEPIECITHLSFSADARGELRAKLEIYVDEIDLEDVDADVTEVSSGKSKAADYEHAAPFDSTIERTGKALPDSETREEVEGNTIWPNGLVRYHLKKSGMMTDSLVGAWVKVDQVDAVIDPLREQVNVLADQLAIMRDKRDEARVEVKRLADEQYDIEFSCLPKSDDPFVTRVRSRILGLIRERDKARRWSKGESVDDDREQEIDRRETDPDIELKKRLTVDLDATDLKEAASAIRVLVYNVGKSNDKIQKLDTRVDEIEAGDASQDVTILNVIERLEKVEMAVEANQ